MAKPTYKLMRNALAILLLVPALQGCGQKGALYLPQPAVSASTDQSQSETQPAKKTAE